LSRIPVINYTFPELGQKEAPPRRGFRPKRLRSHAASVYEPLDVLLVELLLVPLVWLPVPPVLVDDFVDCWVLAGRRPRNPYALPRG
jgi:hypothetical protein